MLTVLSKKYLQKYSLYISELSLSPELNLSCEDKSLLILYVNLKLERSRVSF